MVVAFNAADWDRVREYLAPDVVYAETGTGRNAIGGDARAAQEILWEGTHTGPLQTPAGVLEASGSRIAVEGSVWVRFEGDKAQEVHHYLDVMALLQQIGAT